MLATLLLALATVQAPSQTIATPTVVVVRHAERASSERDAALSAKGMDRAVALDSVLAGARVTAIIVTPFQRTGLTAAQVAKRHGITPTVVEVGRDVAAHAKLVADAARAHGGVVLVVGHSNTVGAIVAALGGPADVGNLCETNHDQLFVVSLAGDGARLVRTRYGVEDAAETRRCA